MATAVYRAQISAEMLGMTLSELKQLKDLLDTINNGKIKISGDIKNIKNVSQTIEKIKSLMGGIEDVQIGESVFDEGKINAQAHDISDNLEQIFKGQTIYLPMDCDESELMNIHDRVTKTFEDKIPIRFELDMSMPNAIKEIKDFSKEAGETLYEKLYSYSHTHFTNKNVAQILKDTLGDDVIPTEDSLKNAINKIYDSMDGYDRDRFEVGKGLLFSDYSEYLKKYEDMVVLERKLREDFSNFDTDVLSGFDTNKLKPYWIESDYYLSNYEGRFRAYYKKFLSFIKNFKDLTARNIENATEEYDAHSWQYDDYVDSYIVEEYEDEIHEQKEKIENLKKQTEEAKKIILELLDEQEDLKEKYDSIQREFQELFESDIKSGNGSSQANIENLEEFINSIGSLIEKLNTIIGDGDADKLKKDIGFIISSMKELMGVSDISESDLMSWGRNSEVIDKRYIKNIDWLSNYISQHEEYIRQSKKLGKQYELDYSDDKIREKYESSDKIMPFEDFRTKELQEYKENIENNNRTIEKELSEIERLKTEREEKLNKLKKIYDKENGGILSSIKDSLNNIVKNRLGSKSDDSGNNLSKFLEVMFPKEEDIIAFKERIDLFIGSFDKLFKAFGTLESESSSNNIFGFIKSIKEILPDIKEAIASVSMNIDLGNSFDDASMGKIVEKQENYLRAYRNQLQEMKRIKGEMSKQSFGKAYRSNALESQVNKRLNMFNEDDYEIFDDKIVAYKKLIEDMEAASLKTYGRNIYADMDKSFKRKVSSAKGNITRQTNESEQKAKNRLANIFGVNVGEDNSKSLSGIENSFTSLLNRIDELIVKVQMLSDAFMGLNNISLAPKIGEEGRFDVIRNNVEKFKKLVEEINIKNIDKFDDNPDSFTKYMNGSNELDYKLIPQNVKNIIDSISEELSIGRITLDEAIEKYKQSFNELFNIKDESSKSVNITDDKNNINNTNEKIMESEQEVANSYIGESQASDELTFSLEKLATAKTNLIIANNFYTGHKFDDVVKAEGEMAKYASEQFERLAMAKGTIGKTTLAEAKKELDKEEKKSAREKTREEARKKALERNPYEGYDFVVYDYEDAINGDHNLGALLNRIGDSSFEKALTEVINKNIIDEKELGKITKVVDRNYINQRRDKEGNAVSVEDRYRTIYTENGSYQFKHVVPTEEQRKAYKEKYGEEFTSGWIIQNTQDEVFNIESYTKATKQLISEEKKLLNLDKELANKNISQSDYDRQANIINRKIKELENVRDLVKSDISSMPTISEMTKGMITDNDDLLKVIRNRNKEYRDNGFRTNQQVEKDNNKSLKENLKEYKKTSQNISRLQRSYMVDNAKYTNARLNGSVTDTELKNMQLIMEVKRNVIEQEKEHLKIVGERIDDENEEKKRIDEERKTQLKLNQSNAKVIFESENSKAQTKTDRERKTIANKNNSEFEKQLNAIKAQEKIIKEAEKRYQDAKSSNSSTPEQIGQLKNSYDNQVKALTRLREEAMSFAESSYGIVDGEQRITDAIIEANNAFEEQQRLESDKQVTKDIKSQKKQEQKESDSAQKQLTGRLNAIAKQVKEVESLRESYGNAISLGLGGNKEYDLLEKAKEKLGGLIEKLKKFARESKHVDETDVINKIADIQKTARDEYNYDKQKRENQKRQNEEERIARENTKSATDSFDKQIKDIQEQSKKIETLRDMYNNSILVNGRDSSGFEGGLLDKATEQLDEMIQKLREFAKESNGVLGFSNYEVNKRIDDAVIYGQKDYVRQQEENAKQANKPYYQQALNNMKKYQEEYAELAKELETETNENRRTDIIYRMGLLEEKVASAREQAERFGSTLKSVADVTNDINNIFSKIDESVSKVTTESDKIEEKRKKQLEKLSENGEVKEANGIFSINGVKGKTVSQKDTKDIISRYLSSIGYSSDISKFKVSGLNDAGIITGKDGFATFSGEVRNATGELVKFIIKYDELNDKMAISTVTEGLGLKFDFKDNLNGSADEVSEAIKKAGDLSKRLNDINKKYEGKFNNDPLALESFTDDIEKLKTAFSELADGGDISEFYKRLNNLTKETNDFDKKYAILAKQIRGESLENGLFEKQKDVEKYLSKYAKENNLGEINGDVRVNRLNNGIVQVIGYARDLNDEVTKITANWSDLTGRMSVSTVDMGQQLTGLAGWFSNLGKRMYTLSQYWFSMYFSPMDLMRYARTIISSVTELDTAMIDLQKTAKMTGGELNQVYDSASEKASKFGITTQEYIQATADMSRAGFSTYKETTTMADATALFTAISPDVEASESATGLVSILRAFDIESENIKDEVLSKINVIGKNNCLNIW